MRRAILSAMNSIRPSASIAWTDFVQRDFGFDYFGHVEDTFLPFETASQQVILKLSMRFLPYIMGIFVSSLPSSGAQKTADEAKFAEFREAISKLVDVQTLESKERADWEAKKASFANLLELHRREIQLLDEELAKAGKTAPAHESQTEDMEEQIEALKQARRLSAEAVARNLPRLIKLSAAFPKPLLVEVEAELTLLKQWGANAEPREGFKQNEPSDALQAMLALLSKAEQFNRRMTRSIEVHEGSEVQVLYLGLAQAYYMDQGSKAGVGRPSAEGWIWESQAAIRDELVDAFDTMDKKRPPATVTLPLKLD
jgi:Skp family chaperone for outer membrane proteins